MLLKSPGLVGRAGSVRSAVTANAAASTLIARMAVQPDATREALIRRTILSLQQAGLLSKLDVLYVRAAHTSQAALLNWINSSYTSTTTASPTFTTDRGYAGNGISSYIDWTWKPSNGVNCAAASGSIFCWNRTNRGVVASQIMGVNDASSAYAILPKWADGNFYGGVNGGVNPVTSAGSDGLLLVSQLAGASTFYRNGVSIGTAGSQVLTRPALNMLELARNNNGTPDRFSSDQSAIAGAGAALTAADVANLYTILQAYMTTVGA